jgi:hypothetical protein
MSTEKTVLSDSREQVLMVGAESKRDEASCNKEASELALVPSQFRKLSRRIQRQNRIHHKGFTPYIPRHIPLEVLAKELYKSNL